MLKKILTLLTLIPSIAFGATTYYADPNGGAAESCVNNTTNACTIARCITVASAGDTCLLNTGSYTSSSQISLNKAITLECSTVSTVVTDTRACIVTGTNASGVMAITPQNAATISVGSIEFVGNAAASNAVSISASANIGTVAFNHTRFSGPATTRELLDSYRGGTTTLTDTGCIGVIPATCYETSGSMADLQTKIITITDPYMNVTGAAALNSTLKGYFITRDPTDDTFQVILTISGNINGSMTSGGGGTNAGVVLFDTLNVKNVSISGGTTIPTASTFTLTATGATGASGDSAFARIRGTTSAAPCSNGEIKNINVTVNAPTGYHLMAGDASTQSYCDNAYIHDFVIKNIFYNGSNTPHNVLLGRNTIGSYGGKVTRGHIYGGAVGVLCSISQSCDVVSNIIEGSYYAPLFSKGTVDSNQSNNTIIMDDSLFGAKIGNYGCIGVAAQGATNNTTSHFYNNNCYIKAGTGWLYNVTDASQTSVSSNNNYFSEVTLISANPWSYQGTGYANLAAWQGAKESTSISVLPQFYFSDTQNYRLLPGSSLIGGGVCYLSTGCIHPDFLGQYQHGKPNIGAYGSYLPLNRSTATGRVSR